MAINRFVVNLDPMVGTEIQKARPCLIVSPDEINHDLRTAIVAPLTTKGQDYPTRVLCRFKGKDGQVVLAAPDRGSQPLDQETGAVGQQHNRASAGGLARDVRSITAPDDLEGEHIRMDEVAWDHTSSVAELLQFLNGRTSDRKLRLFACACYRRIWDRLHVYTRNAAEVAEQVADGLATEDDLQNAYDSAWTWPRHPASNAGWVASSLPMEAAFQSARWERLSAGCQDPAQGHFLMTEEELAQCNMLRDLIGNPFRPVAIASAWLTSNVVDVARTIYEECRYSDFPILADALEDAGCNNAEILNHCRQPGEHVRGCWVLDSLMGW